MNRLRVIDEHVKREHANLVKSAKRPRSLQGILEKSETLKDLFNEYKLVLNKNRHYLSETKWNDEVEIYQEFKVRYMECAKILENTQISTTYIKTFIQVCSQLNYLLQKNKWKF